MWWTKKVNKRNKEIDFVEIEKIILDSLGVDCGSIVLTYLLEMFIFEDKEFLLDKKFDYALDKHGINVHKIPKLKFVRRLFKKDIRIYNLTENCYFIVTYKIYKNTDFPSSAGVLTYNNYRTLLTVNNEHKCILRIKKKTDSNIPDDLYSDYFELI